MQAHVYKAKQKIALATPEKALPRRGCSCENKNCTTHAAHTCTSSRLSPKSVCSCVRRRGCFNLGKRTKLILNINCKHHVLGERRSASYEGVVWTFVMRCQARANICDPKPKIEQQLAPNQIHPPAVVVPPSPVLPSNYSLRIFSWK